MRPFHESLPPRFGHGPSSGSWLFALTLAAGLGLGCAYGTTDANRRLGASDDPCGGGDCEDAGYGGGGDATYPGADSGAPATDSGYVFPDTGPLLPDTSIPDRAAPFDTSVVCVLRLSTGDPTCDSCLAVSCCAEDNACGAAPGCLAFDSCMGTCLGAFPDAGVPIDAGIPTDAGPDADADAAAAPDAAACASACELRFPLGSSLLSSLDSCLSTSCAVECGGP